MNEINKCTHCGLCRKACPVFRATLNESDSPRGKALLIKNEKISKVLLRCTACENCENTCPLKIKFDFKKLRAKLLQKTKESPENKKMIENIRKYGNPFGEPGDDTPPKDLYCC